MIYVVTEFKFQSDSINTETGITRRRVHIHLNSNLILLIQKRRLFLEGEKTNLNSNLILLILCRNAPGADPAS